MIIITGTLSILSLALCDTNKINVPKNQSLKMIPYVSPTMKHDPWENYDDKILQKINDEILKESILNLEP